MADDALHKSNRAAHRGMKVLLNVLDELDNPHDGPIPTDLSPLWVVVREYEEAWQQAQREALR